MHIYDAQTKPLPGCSDAVLDRAARARGVETRLWMAPDEADDVISTGYATTLGMLCHYLTQWRDSIRKGKPNRVDVPFPSVLFERVEALWRAANDDQPATQPQFRD